ncbi:MAG: LLM class flavin-dependent oxidoreductase [Chloroflexi bacterium]|nr:MAG: LLM class flavin-dependent oxidoreductase [Chloroflexota bacterium]
MGIRFGVGMGFVSYPALRDDFLFVESLGLERAWVADQYALPFAPDMPILEAWTALAALAVDTKRIRLGTMVTNVSTRNPAMLAKQVLTVDQISSGRVELAVGSGFYPEEHAYIGVEFPDLRGRSARLAEAVEILDRGLRGDHVTFTGTYFRLAEAPMHPAPIQRPRPPLYVAATVSASLRVAAHFGDAVVAIGGLDQEMGQSLTRFRERMSRLDEMCEAEGRHPASLRRCYVAGFANEPIFESNDSAADFIGRFAEAGATDFCFDLYNPEQPAFASLVTSHRIADRDTLARIVQDVLPEFC